MKPRNIKLILVSGLLTSCISGPAFAQSLFETAYPYKNEVRLHQDGFVTVAGLSKKRETGSGNADRVYYWFSKDSIMHTQGGFSGRLLDGPYRVTYPDGNIKELGSFKKGLKAGVWSWFNSAGRLVDRKHFSRGEELEYEDGRRVREKWYQLWFKKKKVE